MTKIAISAALAANAGAAFAQLAAIVEAPTLEYLAVESKIETATNFAEQLVQLKKMIEEARRQAAKLDSAKRGIEKTYQLQENIRKDAERAYDAVRELNVHNIAHVTEGYLGFSVNPADYMPKMQGLEGYTEFRRSLNYDPVMNIAPNTKYLDDWLMSLTLNPTDSNVKIAMTSPEYNYIEQLQKIQNLTSTYHGQVSRTKLERLATVTLPRHKNALTAYMNMADSVKSTADIIALNTQIQNMADQIERDNAEIDAITEELVKDAARAAMVQDAAVKKQRDLIAITTAITMGYSGNKGKISLRRLAKARHSSDEAQVQRAKELMGKIGTFLHLTCPPAMCIL